MKKTAIIISIVLSHIFISIMIFSSMVFGNDIEVDTLLVPSLHFPSDYTYEVSNNIYIATFDEYLFSIEEQSARYDEELKTYVPYTFEMHIYQVTVIIAFKDEQLSVNHRISVSDFIDIHVGDTYLIRKKSYGFMFMHALFHDLINDNEVVMHWDIIHLIDYDTTLSYDQQPEDLLRYYMPYTLLKEQSEPQN